MYGLTNLMEAALLSSSQLAVPTLILYGEKDEIIPHDPTCVMLDRLPDDSTTRFVLYPDGYHMLMRDLQADVVLEDVVAWVSDQSVALPSGNTVTKNSNEVTSLCQ